MSMTDEILRLNVLQILAASDGFSANEALILQMARSHYGHGVSANEFAGCLQFLEERKLLDLRSPGGLAIAHLTQQGLDVAKGYAKARDVASPSPGS